MVCACIAKMKEEMFGVRGNRLVKIGKEGREYEDYDLCIQGMRFMKMLMRLWWGLGWGRIFLRS